MCSTATLHICLPPFIFLTVHRGCRIFINPHWIYKELKKHSEKIIGKCEVKKKRIGLTDTIFLPNGQKAKMCIIMLFLLVNCTVMNVSS